MSDGPKLYVKCKRSSRKWWTAGKLYPVEDGRIRDDDVDRAMQFRWPLVSLGEDFVPVWVLPDGTELEALP